MTYTPIRTSTSPTPNRYTANPYQWWNRLELHGTNTPGFLVNPPK